MNEPHGKSLFDPDRMRVYPRMLIAAYAMGALALVLLSHALIDPFGQPLGYDFITFWSAGHLTLQGHAADAFDLQKIHEAQRLAVPATEAAFLWHYPPTYQLLVTPLALLPYFAAFFVFVAATLAAYAATVARLLKEKEAILLTLAFPGAFVCAFHGQNSLLTAALFAVAALTIEKRPALAGVAFGLLAYKPQLGLLIPVALLAARQWRAFLAAALTATAFALVATLVLGVDLWLVFFRDAALVREVLQQGLLRWEKMPSAFVFCRMLGLPQWFAYGAQGLTALAAAATVALVWVRQGPTRLAFAVLVAATLLTLPYIFDYEFAIMAVPLAILASDMAARGATRGEKVALLALYGVPAVVATVAKATHVQIGFIALVALLALAVRRCYLSEGFVPAKCTPCFSTPASASPASTTATTPATIASAKL